MFLLFVWISFLSLKYFHNQLGNLSFCYFTTCLCEWPCGFVLLDSFYWNVFKWEFFYKVLTVLVYDELPMPLFFPRTYALIFSFLHKWFSFLFLKASSPATNFDPRVIMLFIVPNHSKKDLKSHLKQ